MKLEISFGLRGAGGLPKNFPDSICGAVASDILLDWRPRPGEDIICASNYVLKTRQSKHCGFSIYIFDNSKSKSMVKLVRAEKMVLSGLVFARKIARMILIQNV